MTIFGKNGLMAAGLYAATVFALYGNNLSGFEKQAEIDNIRRIKVRAEATGDAATVKRAYQAARADAISKSKSLQLDPKFEEAYQKAEWMR